MPNISPVLLREEIARRLRAAREAAGISCAGAARRLDMSRPNLSRVETGQQGVNVHLVRTMMDLYDFRDDDLLEKVRESRKPGWWKAYGVSDHDFLALETGAASATSSFWTSRTTGSPASSMSTMHSARSGSRTPRWLR